MTDRSLRVLHVVPSLDETYGGPATAVPSLATALEAQACASSFLSVAPCGRASVNPLMERHRHTWFEARPLPFPRKGRPAFAARRLLEHILITARIDVIHLHAVWSHLAWVVGEAVGRRAVTLILSPRSDLMDQAQQRSRLAKWCARRLYAAALLSCCDGVHATDRLESESLAAQLPRTPCLVAPNGVSQGFGDALPDPASARRELGLPAEQPVLLFLSRLDARKNPELLLEAAWRAGLFQRGWLLVFAGQAEDAALPRRLQRFAVANGIDASVRLLGHVAYPRNRLCYAAATLFALPSAYENFGNSIAEALACGVPSLVTPDTPWRTLDEVGAGWVGRPTLDIWTRFLREAAEVAPDRLAAMGGAARAHAARFDWQETARATAAFYRAVAKGAS
jgi:glycosyltransferase involved in cell wall biosynthesis